MTVGAGASAPGEEHAQGRECPVHHAWGIPLGSGTYECRNAHRFTDREAELAEQNAAEGHG